MSSRFSDLKFVIRELSFPFMQGPTEKQPLSTAPVTTRVAMATISVAMATISVAITQYFFVEHLQLLHCIYLYNLFKNWIQLLTHYA